MNVKEKERVWMRENFIFRQVDGVKKWVIWNENREQVYLRLGKWEIEKGRKEKNHKIMWKKFGKKEN